jgi:hypothetical protein
MIQIIPIQPPQNLGEIPSTFAIGLFTGEDGRARVAIVSEDGQTVLCVLGREFVFQGGQKVLKVYDEEKPGSYLLTGDADGSISIKNEAGDELNISFLRRIPFDFSRLPDSLQSRLKGVSVEATHTREMAGKPLKL